MDTRGIYFDSAATARPCERALAAAEGAARGFGNPSSTHFMGMAAARLLAGSRQTVADSLCCAPEELVFTGSGSESNNQIITGIAFSRQKRAKTVVATDSEHPSAEMALRFLEECGFKVVRIKTAGGALDTEMLKEALAERVSLVCIMRANNETGALYDIAAVRELIDRSGCGAHFHTDATQSFLKTKNKRELVKYCDSATVSAHKIGGIKGCGGLYVKKGTNLPPLIRGGGQERGLRAGTENLPGIAAFAAACEDWEENPGRADRISALRDYTESALTAALGERILIRRPPERVCGIISASVPGLKSEVMLNFLSAKGICVSAGSACSARSRASGVIAAFGADKAQQESALRISLDHANTKAEADTLAACLKEARETLARGI